MRRATLLAAALALLAGCGSDRSEGGGSPFAALGQVAVQVIGPAVAARRAGAAQAGAPAYPTREQIDGSERELLYATVLARKAGATLAQFGQNAGVTTYTTADSTTLALREGVLVATRGLGEDLMSAAAPSAAQIAAAAGHYEREYHFIGALDEKRSLRIPCTLAPGGSATAEVVGVTYSLREVIETCSSEAGTITNAYYLEPGGRIRISRQWASPTLGYIQIERLSR